MGKGVLADNGLVELHRKTRNGGDAAADLHDLGGVDARVIGHDVVAHLEGHNDLFQCGVARTFAQTVDGAFDLTRTGLNRGQRVCRRHAKVVVTMRCEYDLIRTRHAFQQHPDQIRAFTWGGIAHGVGDVDRGGTGLDRNFDDAAQVVVLGPCGVHGRPLHVIRQVARMADRFVDQVGHFIHAEVRDRTVQGRGADERMDAGPRGVFDGLETAVDVRRVGACQTADHRILAVGGNFTDGAEIALGCNRETGLDDVDTHFVQHRSDLKLFGVAHRGTGGLFPVAQRGVKNQDLILCSRVGHCRIFLV